ncbi:DUF898 domain-containing protein [Sulfitobacter mediterraneus]|nr:DUF898 domain-containing protein [Sulfitobacter mediterraneus]
MTDQSSNAGPWGTPPAAPTASIAAKAPSWMQVEFVGSRWALFWLALKTGFLTVITLGIYRFWMKTRLRRWYWSAIRPGGHPMEYVGDPIEKLLGFFIAVVILTFYIGIVNLLLMFVSFSVFNSSWVGYLASFAGVIPIWFYARYRARRYVLGRTRWRGVRFGLEKGAWGYAWRALVHWAITLCTLGILWPRMTFWLEKYRTDRTFFGSARLTQGGHWTMLYRAAVPFVLSLIATGALVIWLIWIAPLFPQMEGSVDGFVAGVEGFFTEEGPAAVAASPERVLLGLLCILGLIYGAVHYRWTAKRILANHKTAPGITFHSGLNSARIAMIYVLGVLISYLVLTFSVLLVILMGAAVLGFDSFLAWFGLGSMSAVGDWPRWVAVVLMGLLYLSAFLLWGVLYNTFVTFPIMRHMALTTRLPDHHGLDHISQRARDDFAEAEGFAEALDLGAAI